MARRDPTAPALDGSMRFEAFAGRTIAMLSPQLQVRLSGGVPTVIDGQTLDPACQLLLSVSERRGLGAEPGKAGVMAERRMLREQAIIGGGVPDPVASVSDITVGGAEGPLRARHYRSPEPGGPHPLLVFFHGGGFVLGDLDSHDSICRALARHGGVDVLAIDYRLAPEHRFPAPADDARAAYEWALANAADLGADPTRVLVGGDSAGGNLAAVTSYATARSLTPPPFAQLLIYPVTDLAEQRPSYGLFSEGFLLTRRLMEWFRETYVHPDDADPHDVRISPLRAGDLTGLPPAIIVTAGFDPLRDEGEAYAEALRDAGNTVVARRFPSLIHGFANMGGVSRAAREAIIEIAGTLRAITRI